MKLFLALLLVLPVACTAQQTPAPVLVTDANIVLPESTLVNDVLFKCTYKYDSKYNVEFLDSNRIVYHPPTLPELTVYRITDTKGGKWSINEYDWLNYTCTQTIIKR